MKAATVALGDVVHVKGGGTPSKSKPEYYTGDIPWVTPKDMKFWEIDDAIDKITEEAVTHSATNLIPEGAILLVNRSGILKHTLPVGITRRPVAINQDIKALVCSEHAYPAYIAHLIKAAEPTVLTWVRATTADNFPIQNLKELIIPLPPLDEQRRIAGILDQADALRRLRARALDKLNTLGQAIFHEMFGDPVKNREGWDQVRLGDLCEVGSSKRVFVEEFVDEGVPFFRGTEVGKLATGEKIEPNLFVSPDHYVNLVAHSGRPEVGDLLLPSICHDGRIWKVDHDRPFYFKDGRVLWIKSHKAKINSEYLRNHLRVLFLNNYTAIASGTTFAELKIVNLKNLLILHPPEDLQEKFAVRIAEIQKKVHQLELAASRSKTLFTSLQHRAFRGEL